MWKNLGWMVWKSSKTTYKRQFGNTGFFNGRKNMTIREQLEAEMDQEEIKETEEEIAGVHLETSQSLLIR